PAMDFPISPLPTAKRGGRGAGGEGQTPGAREQRNVARCLLRMLRSRSRTAGRGCESITVGHDGLAPSHEQAAASRCSPVSSSLHSQSRPRTGSPGALLYSVHVLQPTVVGARRPLPGSTSTPLRATLLP